MQNYPIQQNELSLNRLVEASKQPSREWQVYLAAIAYIDAGLYVIPVTPGTKRLPYDKENPARCLNYGHPSRRREIIDKWFDPNDGLFTSYNIGIATGKEDGCFVIDVDMPKEDKPYDGHESLAALEEKHGKLPIGPVAETPSGGHHYLFQWQEHATSDASGKIGPNIDSRGGFADKFKGHINVWPSVVGGKDYKWVRGGALPILPKWVCDKLGILWQAGGRGRGRGNENVTDDDLERSIEKDQIINMLGHMDPNEFEYDDWLKVGLSIKSQLPGQDGMELWNEWSKRGKRYKDGECINRWSGFSDTGTVRGGTLFHYAREAGWEPNFDGGERSGNPLDEIVAGINRKFAITLVGGRIRIIREREIVDNETQMHYDLMDKKSFEILMADQLFQRGKRLIPVSQIWFAHQGRRVYESGIGLFPDNKVPPGYFNTWFGYSVEPTQGDCSLFLRHLKEVICGGDESHCEWLLDWCADLVQDPANPKGCAIIMRGGEGTGKGTFANTIGDIFGPHHRHLIDDSHLTSNFNAHLFDAITVFADEITWGGNKKTAGKLKGMVTEKTLVGERKGIDAVPYRNRVHLIVASNSQWVIPAGADSRRWFVLDVADAYAKKANYFKAVYKELNNGGREAFLHQMLERKISADLRTAPKTKALHEQRLLNTHDNTVLNWWVGILTKGIAPVPDVINPELEWPEKVNKSSLHEHYEAYCDRKRIRSVAVSLFAKEMMKYGVKNERITINKRRVYVFVIPLYDTCKEVVNNVYEGIFGEEDDKDRVLHRGSDKG